MATIFDLEARIQNNPLPRERVRAKRAVRGFSPRRRYQQASALADGVPLTLPTPSALATSIDVALSQGRGEICAC
jgi:hypothetical protein